MMLLLLRLGLNGGHAMPVTLQAFLSEVIREYGFNGRVTLAIQAERKSTYEIEMTIGIEDESRKFIVDGDMVFDVTKDNAGNL